MLSAGLRVVAALIAGCYASTEVRAQDHVVTYHYVSKTGSNIPPYDTPETAAWSIADAIALSGDFSGIAVDEGVYEGNVTLAGNRTLWCHGPKRAVIRGVPRTDSCAALTLAHSARVWGLTIDGSGCWMAVDCAPGTPVLTHCEITGGRHQGIHVSGSAPWIEYCFIYGNGVGLHCGSGSAALTSCVVSRNSLGVLGLEQAFVALIHCTITDNSGPGVQGIEGELAIRHSIIWGNARADLYAVAPWEVVDCDVGEPDGWSGTHFSGFNGNISVNPLFIGWGEFNDSDYPIFVDASHAGPEAGTRTSPFRSIGAALNVYDYHLAVGSPCVAAGSDGRNIGAFPDGTPVAEAGPKSVLIRVAPGLYEESDLTLVHGVHLRGSGPHLTTLSPPRYRPAASLVDGSLIDGFSVLVEQAAVAIIADGHDAVVANCIITSRGQAPWMPSDIGIRSTGGRVFNSVIHGTRHAVWGSADILNCTITQNTEEALIFEPEAPPTVRNCILWANGTSTLTLPCENVSYSVVSEPSLAGINRNILADPQFVNPHKADFHLLPTSPCIDAGFNARDLLETDIAGTHRVVFGGKSLTVDMGAYEFYINDLKPGPNPDQATLTWSSLADGSYSIFYTEDLLTWHLAVQNLPSSGNEATSWTDDGSLTGLPPSLVPRRFYRVLENP